jgi:hypothetical protein
MEQEDGMRNGRRDRKGKDRRQRVRPSSAEMSLRPRNADRVAWAGSAMAAFAAAAGMREDLRIDPETAVGDLLADLMHWCDACGVIGLPAKAIDFEAALERARAHYGNEANKRRGKVGKSPRITTPPT